MPSISYGRWRSMRAALLDQVEVAHTAVGGAGRGARYARQQLNHSYCVLLAAEFQGFSRELHTEAVTAMVPHLPLNFRTIVEKEFVRNRQLDRGNATSATLGSDFGRLGVELWNTFDVMEPHGPRLRRHLEDLNTWRNAIAHSDYDPSRLNGKILLTIAQVRRWRRACHRVARTLDRLVAIHIHVVTGVRPWG
jgi:hypothetical protein